MSQNVAKCKVMYTMYTNRVRCILGDLWICPFVSPKKKTDTAILRLRAAPTRRRSNKSVDNKPISCQDAFAWTHTGETVTKTHTGKTDTSETVTSETHTGETVTSETHTGKADTGETVTSETVTSETHTGETVTSETHTGKTDTGESQSPVRQTPVRQTPVRQTPVRQTPVTSDQ